MDIENKLNSHAEQITISSCISQGIWEIYMATGAAIVQTDLTATMPHSLISDSGGFILSELIDLSATLSPQQLVSICSAQATRHIFGTNESFPTDRNEILYFYGLHFSAQIEAKLMQIMWENVDRILILRDLLRHRALEIHLPLCFIEICKYLFLPQHLNFRNLLWHGFMKVDEIPVQYVSLCISINHTLDAIISSSIFPVGTPKRRDFSSVHSTFAHFVEILHRITYQEFDIVLTQSIFCAPGRHSLYRKSFKLFKQSQYKKSIIMLLPMLEHGLRLAFCISNKSFEYIFASADVYFSTLDGFGQRGKHQLLLDPNIHVYDGKFMTSESKPNELIRILGDGLYGVLIDLFLTDRGPNVRALFAHGEYSLSCTRLSLTDDVYDTNTDNDEDSFRVMASTLLVLVTALLYHFRSDGQVCQQLRDIMSSVAINRPLTLSEYLCDYMINNLNANVSVECPETINTCYSELTGWYSNFHDHSIITIEHQRLWSDIIFLCREVRNRSNITISEKRTSKLGDSEFRIDIDVLEPQPSYTVTVWESNKRIRSYFPHGVLDCLLVDDIRSLTFMGDPESSLANDVRVIVDTCIMYIQQIMIVFEKSFPTSQFLEQAIELIRASNDRKNVKNDILRDITPSLYDHISVTSPPITLLPACLQLQKHVSELASSVLRSLQIKERLITSGAAHSSDRKQYLSILFYALPVSVAISVLSSSILICHYKTSGLSNKSQNLHPLIKNLAAIMPSFLVCIASHASYPTGADGKNGHVIGEKAVTCNAEKFGESVSLDTKQCLDKKSIEKAVKQVLNMLKSKSTRISILLFMRTENSST